MSWLKKISQMAPPTSPMPPTPQVTLTTNQMMKIINDVLLNVGDINYAAQKFQEAAPLPEEVCNTINEVAGVNAAARPKMQTLAEAGGCYWNPQNPTMDQQQQQQQPNMMDPAVTPMMGQQEKPMGMPSMEIE